MPPFRIIINMLDLFIKTANANIVHNLKWVIPFCFVYICTFVSFHSPCTSIFMTPKIVQIPLPGWSSICSMWPSLCFQILQKCSSNVVLYLHTHNGSFKHYFFSNCYQLEKDPGDGYKRKWSSTFLKDFIWLIRTYRL